MLFFRAGQTSQSVILCLQDSSATDGSGLTGLKYNTAGLTVYYKVGGTGALTQITLATLASDESAWTSGGFVEVDATNAPGWYRLDLPNAAVASENFVSLIFKGATNLAETSFRLECRLFPSDLRELQGDSTSATDLKSLVDTDFEARTIPSGEYFNWSEDADFSSLQTYIDGRTIPSSDYFDSTSDSVNLGAILGTSLTESNGGDLANNVSQFFDVNPTTTKTIDDVGGSSSLSLADIADAVWDEDLSGHNTPSTAGHHLINSDLVIDSGTIEFTPTNALFATSVGSKSNSFYHDTILSFTSGALAGQSRVITSYSSSSGFGTFGFDEPFTDAPSSGDVFNIYRGHTHSDTQLAGAVWSRATTITPPIDSYGAALLDVPSNSEFEARTLPSGEYFNSSENFVNISSSSRESLVDEVWDEVITNSIHNVSNSAGKRLRQAGTIIAADGEVNDVSPSSGEFITSLTESNSSFYSDQCLIFTSGGLTGQGRIITSYDGDTKTVTFDEPFTFSPSNTDEFSICAAHVHSETEISYNVWNSDINNNESGTFGYQLNNVLNDIPNNSEFESRTLPSGEYFNPTEDTVANVGLVDVCTTNADMRGTDGANTTAPDNASITSILEDTSTTIPALINALADIDSDTVKSAVAAIVVESQGSYTLQQALSVILSVLAGQSSDNGLTFKTPNGSATRVAATVDENKNRTNMDITPSS